MTRLPGIRRLVVWNRRRIADGERGAVLALFAIALPALLMMTALAVDIGHIRMERRDLQSVADAVALDSVRSLDVYRTNPNAWNAIVVQSRERNAFASNGNEVDSIRDLSAVPGCYDQDADFFTPVGTGACTTALMDSVRAVATDTVDFHFNVLSDIAMDAGATTREAVARLGDKKQGEFLVGSFVASLDPTSSSALGKLLNDVVPGASLISYNGIATSNITLAQLGAFLPVTAGSPEELLNTSFTIQELALASAQALQANGATAAQVSALNQLANIPVPSQEVRLGDALGISAGGTPGAETQINVPQLLAGSVIAIDGEHTLTLNLAGAVPGVGSVDIELDGIEAPQRGGIEDGASATTEQARLKITPHIAVELEDLSACDVPAGGERNLVLSLLNALLGPLVCALTPLLAPIIDIRIDATPTFAVTLAEVTATQHLDCINKKMTISSTPAVITLDTQQKVNVQLRVGGGNPINILEILNKAGARSEGTPTGPPPVFSASGPGPHYTTFTPKDAQVGANPLGLKDLLDITDPDNTTVTVLNLNLSGLGQTVKNLITTPLNNLLGQIDTHFIDPIARLLGLNIGGAKLTPLWMQCELNQVQLGR